MSEVPVPAPVADPHPGPTGTPLVVVVGAGVAGLAAAWELAAAGIRTAVLEADATVGGKLRQVDVAGVRVDVGPDAFLARRPEARTLCEEVGLGDQLDTPGASGAEVWARGRLRRLPDGLVMGVPTRVGPLARSGIVGPAEWLRTVPDLLARRPVVDDAPAGDGRPTDRSVAELVLPRLGRAVTERLVDPLVGGIHAGPVAAMSAEAVFPLLLQAAATPGSLMRALAAAAAPPAPSPGGPAAPSAPAPVFLSVRGGMARLAGQLADRLTAAGVEVRTSCPVTGLQAPTGGGPWTVHTPDGPRSADGVVLAVPAPAAAALLGGPPPTPWDDRSEDSRSEDSRSEDDRSEDSRPGTHRLARFLGAVDYGGVAVVTLAFAPDGPAARWRRAPTTGFLVPASQGLLTTGCTWLSAKWPSLAPDGPVMVRISAGRAGDRRALSLPDDVLVHRLLAELRALAGDVDAPLDTEVTRWEEAFPQYRVGQRRWAADVAAAAAALPALALAGAAYDGVGVPACIGTGRRAAGQVMAALGTRPPR